MSVADWRNLATLSVIVSIVLLGASLWLWFELSAERAHTDALQSRVIELERAQAPAREVVVAAPVEPPTVTPVPAPAVQEKTPPTRVAAKTQGNAQQPTGMTYGEYQRRRLSNPQYREAWRAQRRLEIAAPNRDLAAALRISQETADQLLDLWVEEELRWAEKPHPNPTTAEEVRARELEIKEAQRLHDAELAKLLGAARVEEWKQYQASLPTRHQVHELRATLAAGTEPLREDQMEPLISAIYAEQKQLKDEMLEFHATLDWSDGMAQASYARRNERYLERATAANERIRAAAASILSQRQLTSLDDMLRRQLDMEDAQFRLERAMGDMRARGKLNLSKSD